MKTDEFFFEAEDRAKIFGYRWTDDNRTPKAIVQIAHGMGEHAGRYADFAHSLIEHGYAVFANDHRGHGRTAGGDSEQSGYFADQNGWQRVVDDMQVLRKEIRKEFAGLPVFLFGHSMGSFLSRHYAFAYGGDLKGLVLSGTGADPGLVGRIGALVAAWECRSKGRKWRSQRLTQLSFGAFNKQFRPNRTDYDWLSRDTAQVDKYIADPYCGGVFTAGFFYDLFDGLKQINRSSNVANTPKKLPIYLFSGENDPVGNNGKGVRQIFYKYRKAGIEDVTMKLYPGGRHEMLNENNKEEVYRDVAAWLDAHLG